MGIDKGDVRFVASTGDVQELFDSAKAAEKGHLYTPQIVLLDLDMPCEGGIEILKMIKQDDDSPWLRSNVIVTSACEEVGFPDKCYDFGASHFLYKPIDIQALQSVIESIVS